MSWGDPNSAAVQNVEKRAQKGLHSRARRQAEARSKEPNTFTRKAAERRHSDIWSRQSKNGWLPWPFS